MVANRSRYGLLVATLGAVLLAVAVFLPWYGLSFTSTGVSYIQQFGNQVASEYGNAQLQSYVAGLHPTISALAGHQFAAVSAHEVLKDMNIALLILAALGLIDALMPLVLSDDALPAGAGRSLVLLGGVASCCVVFRMFDRPVPEGGFIAMSLREGCWLALLGGLMMLLGGVWPRVSSAPISEARVEGAWTGLSGWTPQE
jgi:hypothetical protein